MPHRVEQRVREWSEAADRELDYLALWRVVSYLADNLFCDYTPASGPHAGFRSRLSSWLENVAEKSDQQTLFRLIPLVFFCGDREMLSLHRAALNGPIVRWLVEKADIPLSAVDFGARVDAAISETWFCCITDSSDIASFYHANSISGRRYRPSIDTLAQLGDPASMESFIQRYAIRRLVVLEDFVGSGKQAAPSIKFLTKTLCGGKLDTLFVPLIVCPDGVEAGRRWEAAHRELTFSPVLPLPEWLFVKPLPPSRELDPRFFARVRELVQRVHLRVKGGDVPDDSVGLDGPFGFRDTGALVVTAQNCPDNTLPIIHHTSDSWDPLFPRSSRQ